MYADRPRVISSPPLSPGQTAPPPPNPTPPSPPPEWKRPRPQHHCWLILAACSAAYLLSTWLQKKVLLDISTIYFSAKTEICFSYFRQNIFKLKKLQRLQKLPFTNKRHKCPLGYSGSSYLSLLSRIVLPPFYCLSCLPCLLVPEILFKIVNRIAALSSPQMFTSVVIQEVVWSMLWCLVKDWDKPQRLTQLIKPQATNITCVHIIY